MTTPISREDLAALVEGDAQLIEVLPPHEFEEEHLAGAINIPLKKLDAKAVSGLDRANPVIVYCWDSL